MIVACYSTSCVVFLTGHILCTIQWGPHMVFLVCVSILPVTRKFALEIVVKTSKLYKNTLTIKQDWVFEV